MNIPNRFKKLTRSAAALGVGGALVLGAMLMPAPAQARDRDFRHQGHHRSRHGGSSHFRVPHRIHHRNHHDFRRFSHGRVWFRPHGHFHAVYRFPVHTSRGPVYRPYAYCDGDLYAGSGFSVSIHSGRAGFAYRRHQPIRHHDRRHWRHDDDSHRH